MVGTGVFTASAEIELRAIGGCEASGLRHEGQQHAQVIWE